MSKDLASGLKTLADVKRHEERQAAKQLSQARELLDHENRNLATLTQYLTEYGSVDAISRSRMFAEGHRFRLQLLRSVDAQRAAVAHAQSQAEAARKQWAAIRSEHEAVNKLLERRSDERRRLERRSDQLQSDEHAVRQSASHAADSSR